MEPTVLITGGLGFIGSHTTVEFLKAKYRVIVVDNLFNSRYEVLDRMHKLVFGTPFDPETSQKLLFHKADITDIVALGNVFEIYGNQIMGVLHFASLKSIPHSISNPLQVYAVNVAGSINLFTCMEKHGIRNCTFSSSASVYGIQKIKIKEGASTEPVNPYGETKLIVEGLLRNLQRSNQWSVVILRYFNPMGCEKTGMLGEDPVDPLQINLQTIIAQVMGGDRPLLQVFGNKFDTPDGSAIRDYVHVVDVAQGHVVSLAKWGSKGAFTYNLGLGRGYSVFDVIDAWQAVLGRPVPYTIAPPRDGDPDILVADTSLASHELQWEAKYELKEMVQDFWNFWKQNKVRTTEQKSC